MRYLLVCVAALLLAFAPAPLKKREPRHDGVRRYTLNYQGQQWAITIQPCGLYTARRNGTVWVGRWEPYQSGIMVHEGPMGGKPCLRWYATIDGNIATFMGYVEHGKLL